MQELLEKLTACFDRLQTLEIKPTLTNMETLVQTLYDLRDIYHKIEVQNDGRNQADNGGRDNA